MSPLHGACLLLPPKILILFQVDRDFEDVESRIVGRIRRHPSKPLPKYNDARRIALQQRTIFVGGFPRENVTVDHLMDYIEGNFDQVRERVV